MKNLLVTPSYKAGAVRLADHIELVALRAPHYRASQTDIIASFNRREDENEDEFERPVLQAFEELELRQKHLGRFARHYPFQLEKTSLAFRGSLNHSKLLYLFLLLATRLNMRDDRRHAGLDGAALFEQLSCEIARNFWAGCRRPIDDTVDAFVFGTSRSTLRQWNVQSIGRARFGDAVEDLCERLGEGGYFLPKTTNPIHAKDDRVDVVVWRGFSDKRNGQLIGFGQCKTGTHYAGDLSRLRPTAFCQKWLAMTPAAPPLSLFFVSDRVAGDLYNECADCGILFDRCRALDYAQRLPLKLRRACARWTEVVLRKHRLG